MVHFCPGCEPMTLHFPLFFFFSLDFVVNIPSVNFSVAILLPHRLYCQHYLWYMCMCQQGSHSRFREWGTSGCGCGRGRGSCHKGPPSGSWALPLTAFLIVRTIRISYHHCHYQTATTNFPPVVVFLSSKCILKLPSSLVGSNV